VSSATVILAPYLGLFSSNRATQVLSVATLAMLAVLLNAGKRSTGAGSAYILLIPVVGLAFSYALLNSTIKTIRQGGVVWRNHLYPLAELKAHIKVRTRWLDAAWKETRRRQSG
jgi:hypothetical protein